MAQRQFNSYDITNETDNIPCKMNGSGVCDLDISPPSENEITKRKPSMMKMKQKLIQFWSHDPNILFQQPYVFEFFPVETMTYEQKLNAVTRTVIVLTVITFLYTKSTRLLAVSSVTILAIFLLHFAHMQSAGVRSTKDPRIRYTDLAEGFGGGGTKTSDPNLISEGDYHGGPYIRMPNSNNDIIQMQDKINNAELFVAPVPQNPMGNVLLTDYDYNPHKKPAPPSYTEPVGDDILAQAKRMVIAANPGQPDIANKLFNDLGDDYMFEQSMQPFYSTANTTIPNDQAGFADFCYGSMVSAKEGNMFALTNNNPRYNLY